MSKIVFLDNRRFLCLIIGLLFLIYGCASTQTRDVEDIQLALKSKKLKDEKERIEDVVAQITERNRNIENSKEWLKKAYSALMIKRMNDIPKGEYRNYKRFMTKDTVYIVVHPAYHIFFMNTDILSAKDDAINFPSENIVERFYKKIYLFDNSNKIFKEQERILRDFLEFMSTDEKLVILVMPGDYKTHLSYGYIDGLDEYARYINEATNMSESVIYLDSVSYDQGELSEENLNMLTLFLHEIGAKTIALGGGYFGRCLGSFYLSIGKKFGLNNIYFVPELTAISPMDLNEPWTDGMLTKSGRLNIKVATRNLLEDNPYGMIIPLQLRIRNLPFSFYRSKAK